MEPIGNDNNSNNNKEKLINKSIVNNKTDESKITIKKYAIIHGYNGHKYSGNQKNPGVKTIEEELERTLHLSSFISKKDFGNFKKTSWMRASRTDKGVSAVMNVVNCKLIKNNLMDIIKMKEIVNNNLPSDIKVFRFIQVSETFDAKKTNNNREYIYILPSFMLEPISVSKDSNNNLALIPMNSYKPNYSFKLSPEFKEKIDSIGKEFLGIKKFHNYTRKIPFSSPESVRQIYDISIKEIIDFESFEALKIKIVGQSFLYNQIRKMIGMIIELCRNSKTIQYLNNSFLSNKMEIPIAPPDGLYLRRIDYSRYNETKYVKKNNIFITEEDEMEMDLFEESIIKDIEKRETNDGVFRQWQWRFDNKKDSIYSLTNN